jgi:hypothetical protein
MVYIIGKGSAMRSLWRPHCGPPCHRHGFPEYPRASMSTTYTSKDLEVLAGLGPVSSPSGYVHGYLTAQSPGPRGGR